MKSPPAFGRTSPGSRRQPSRVYWVAAFAALPPTNGTKNTANANANAIATGFGIPRVDNDRTIEGTSRKERNGTEVGLTSGSPRPSSVIPDPRGDRHIRSRLTAPPACAPLSPEDALAQRVGWPTSGQAT